MSVNQIERAYRAWPILTRIASKKTKITYGEMGEELGIHHRTIRYVLGVIQSYCMEVNLPPLTILVVNASDRPGAGFIAYDLARFDDGLTEVWDYPWKEHENPFTFAADGDSYDSIVNELVNEPESSGDVYTRVKSRGVKQIIFRDALLKAYSSKCAFTELSFTNALEACHIVPWSQANDQEKMDVRNGILLNNIHHKLFDNGLITISTEYEIIYYDSNGTEREYSSLDKALTTDLHGQTMRIPRKIVNRPLADYIKKHHIINE